MTENLITEGRAPGRESLLWRDSDRVFSDTLPVPANPAQQEPAVSRTVIINWRAPRTLGQRLRDAWTELWA